MSVAALAGGTAAQASVGADHTPITSPQAAGALAGFLRALHRTAPGEAPANPNRGVPLETLRHDFGDWFPRRQADLGSSGLDGV